MPIGGSATEFNITGAKLKVSGGVQVSGSIAYTTDATGFGGVTAQIDGNNTLNITSGKLTGVTKIDRSTAANITAITHTNVNNNTTIHIALKNTSSIKGDFVTIGTFEDDDNVKVNYTDEYVIGPGETGMLTLRKVNGVLSLFIREMFSSTATNTDTKPFYIKDGTNYKYPLYKSADNGGNLNIVPINGVNYYEPAGGHTTKTRPPLGIPELIVSPSGNLAIGNNNDLTTVNYDVWGVPSSFDFGSIYQGSTKKTSFLLENGEVSGTFTESGASSGDAYSLYIERTDLSTSDTVSSSSAGDIILAFHHDTFANSGDPYGDGTLAGATANSHVFTDTQTGTYDWGTLTGNTLTSTNTTYTWTPPSEITGSNVLMVAGGGGGGKNAGAGGGAGGLLHHTNQSLSGQKTIVVGAGGAGGSGSSTTIPSTNGSNTTFDTYTAIGGGRGTDSNSTGGNGGSGGGSAAGTPPQAGGSGTPGQGNDGGRGMHAGGVERSGAGGGGAGGVGQDSVSQTQGGAGGAGRDMSLTFGSVYGVSGYFAGGGGGAAHYTSTGGAGGSGGGGEGGSNSGTTVKLSDPDPGTRHTGGGGGAGGGGGFIGADGGSGIVLIKFEKFTSKIIPKVTGASFDSTNVTFTVQDASNITNIKYTINGGSEQTTPVGTLAVAHSLASAASITVVAWAVDTNGNQLSAKKTVTGTIPLQPTLVNTISLTGGDWSTQNPVGQYDYINTNTNSTYYEYELSIASGNSDYYIAYNWTTKKWFDTNTGTNNNTFGTSATDTGTTSRETSENPSVVYVFSSQLEAQFNNPYYQT